MAQAKKSNSPSKAVQPAHAKREYRLHVRLPEDARKTVEDAANVKGLSVASFVRTSVLDAAREVMSHSFQALVR